MQLLLWPMRNQRSSVDAGEPEKIARPREYLSALWRNSYYLWRIARVRKDEAGTKSAERALKTYLNRTDGSMYEVEDYRTFLGEGKRND